VQAGLQPNPLGEQGKGQEERGEGTEKEGLEGKGNGKRKGKGNFVR